jgi:hypothetical protein
MQLTSLISTDLFKESSVQQHKLGEKGETVDGRIFRYAQAGEAITIGRITQSPAIDTATITMAVSAVAAIGATSITFTHGATTSTANEYAEGFATISYGTGIGQTLKVKDHAAYTSAQAGAVVNLEDPLIVALDTTSKLDLAHNPWNGVLMDTSQVTCPTGVSLIGMTSTYYGWLQTKGICGCYSDSTLTAGYQLMIDGSTAGAVDLQTDNEFQKWSVGHAVQAGANTYCHQIFLEID